MSLGCGYDLWNVKEECVCVGKNKLNIKTEVKL